MLYFPKIFLFLYLVGDVQTEVQATYELRVVLHGVEQRRTPGEIPDPADGEAITLIEWSFFFLCDGPNGSKP